MYIAYNMITLEGIKKFKDKKHGQQFSTKLNIGEGYEKYGCVYDKSFYDKTCKKINTKVVDTEK